MDFYIIIKNDPSKPGKKLAWNFHSNNWTSAVTAKCRYKATKDRAGTTYGAACERTFRQLCDRSNEDDNLQIVLERYVRENFYGTSMGEGLSFK